MYFSYIRLYYSIDWEIAKNNAVLYDVDEILCIFLIFDTTIDREIGKNKAVLYEVDQIICIIFFFIRHYTVD